MTAALPPSYVNAPVLIAYAEADDALIVTMIRILGLCWAYDYERTPALAPEQLADLTGRPRSTLYRHLKELRDMRWIRVDQAGRRIILRPVIGCLAQPTAKGECTMNKRWMLAILALLLVLVAASPAIAAGPANQNRHENQNRNRTGADLGTMPGKPVFALTGTVIALGADSITVLVYNGNRYVKPYFGQELVVLVTENTRYWQWTPDGYLPIGFGDVQVGDTTSMRGLMSDGTFTALRVTIDVPCCTP